MGKYAWEYFKRKSGLVYIRQNLPSRPLPL
nr:MAG TPA: hypothetical protein [Caudoviricetes sp.]